MSVLQRCYLFLILGLNSTFLFASDLCNQYGSLCANNQSTISDLNSSNSTNLQNNSNSLSSSLSTISTQLTIDLQNIDSQVTADLLVVTIKLQSDLSNVSTQLQTDLNVVTTKLTNDLNSSTTQFQTNLSVITTKLSDDISTSSSQLQTQLTASSNLLNVNLQASTDKYNIDLVGADALQTIVLTTAYDLEQDALNAENVLEQDVLTATNQAEQVVINTQSQLQQEALTVTNQAEKSVLNEQSQLQQDAINTQNAIDVAVINTTSQTQQSVITTTGQLNKTVIQVSSQVQTDTQTILTVVKNEQSELVNTVGELTVILEQKENQEIENFNDSLTAIENGITSIDTARDNISKLEAQLNDLGDAEKVLLETEIATLKVQLNALENQLVAQYDKDYAHFLKVNSLINQISFSSLLSQFDFAIAYDFSSFDSEQINNQYQSTTNVGFYFSQDDLLLPLFYNLTDNMVVGATVPIQDQIDSALLHVRLHTSKGMFDYSDIQFDSFIDDDEWHPGVSVNFKENFTLVGFNFLMSLKETKGDYLNFRNQFGISLNSSFGVLLAQYSRNRFFQDFNGSNVVLNEVILGYRQPWTIFGLLPAPIDLDWVINIPIDEKLYINSHVYGLTAPEPSFFLGFSQSF